MNYNETVDKVMVLLKEKEMCFSNQKSHRDCYESLGFFMKQRNEGYSEAIRESWWSHVVANLMVPSARLLSCGARTLAGTIAVS